MLKQGLPESKLNTTGIKRSLDVSNSSLSVKPSRKKHDFVVTKTENDYDDNAEEIENEFFVEEGDEGDPVFEAVEYIELDEVATQEEITDDSKPDIVSLHSFPLKTIKQVEWFEKEIANLQSPFRDHVVGKSFERFSRFIILDNIIYF